jgi:hypothetical protein
MEKMIHLNDILKDLLNRSWKWFVIVILLIIVFCSCTAKKTSVERTIVSDTLKSVSMTYKTAPIVSSYEIELVCDTITGEVKPLNFNESSGNNSANLKIENNKLKALLKVAETTNKTDTIYKSISKDVYKDREVVKWKTPLWHWILHLVFLVLIVIYLAKKFNVYAKFFM